MRPPAVPPTQTKIVTSAVSLSLVVAAPIRERVPTAGQSPALIPKNSIRPSPSKNWRPIRSAAKSVPNKANKPQAMLPTPNSTKNALAMACV